MNLPVEQASVKVLMADSFLLLKLCWPNKIWFCFLCGKTCQNIRRLVFHTHLGLPALFISRASQALQPLLLQIQEMWNLYIGLPLGKADKHACWRPGLILVITENKGTPVSEKEEMIVYCPAGKRDGALLPNGLFHKVSVVWELVKCGLASW